MLVDPTSAEEELLASTFTVVLSPSGEVCHVQKAWGVGLPQQKVGTGDSSARGLGGLGGAQHTRCGRSPLGRTLLALVGWLGALASACLEFVTIWFS